MPIFKNCIVRNGKVWCYDRVLRKVVEAELTVKEQQSKCPRDIERELLKREFGFKDEGD